LGVIDVNGSLSVDFKFKANFGLSILVNWDDGDPSPNNTGLTLD
jgi:hypothetical protein